MSIIQELNRAAVQRYLTLTRLPLTVAEGVVQRRDVDTQTWPPALFFEGFEATVKSVVGTVWRDDVLRRDADLQRARVAQLRRAGRLEAEAEATRTRADDELAARRAEAEEQRDEVEDRAEADRRRVERERQEAERRAEERAREKEQRAEEVAEAERERLEREERAARAERLEAEREALAERRDALEAEDESVRLRDAAASTRQRRKSKSA